MTTASLTVRGTAALEKGYHYEGTIATGVTGPSIMIPAILNEKQITCLLVAGANTGSIQVTTSTDAKVASDTASWQTWGTGVTTGTVSDVVVGPITAIRGVSAAGEISIEVVV